MESSAAASAADRRRIGPLKKLPVSMLVKARAVSVHGNWKKLVTQNDELDKDYWEAFEAELESEAKILVLRNKDKKNKEAEKQEAQKKKHVSLPTVRRNPARATYGVNVKELVKKPLKKPVKEPVKKPVKEASSSTGKHADDGVVNAEFMDDYPVEIEGASLGSAFHDDDDKEINYGAVSFKKIVQNIDGMYLVNLIHGLEKELPQSLKKDFSTWLNLMAYEVTDGWYTVAKQTESWTPDGTSVYSVELPCGTKCGAKGGAGRERKKYVGLAICVAKFATDEENSQKKLAKHKMNHILTQAFLDCDFK